MQDTSVLVVLVFNHDVTFLLLSIVIWELNCDEETFGESHALYSYAKFCGIGIDSLSHDTNAIFCPLLSCFGEREENSNDGMQHDEDRREISMDQISDKSIVKEEHHDHE